MCSGSTAERQPGASLAAYPSPRTLVLGLGNPILRDDGVGWRIVESLRGRESPLGNNIEFDTFSRGGLALMERLIGYRRAVLVDAIETEGGAPGTVHRLKPDRLPRPPSLRARHSDSVHDLSLPAALELGRRLGAELPDEVYIVAVEVADAHDFGETLTPEVEAAVGRAAEEVIRILEEVHP